MPPTWRRFGRRIITPAAPSDQLGRVVAMLYLASPLTVAASAVEGEIVEYHDGMFAKPR